MQNNFMRGTIRIAKIVMILTYRCLSYNIFCFAKSNPIATDTKSKPTFVWESFVLNNAVR